MNKTLRSGKTIIIELWLRKNLYYVSTRIKGFQVKRIAQARNPYTAINLALKKLTFTEEKELFENDLKILLDKLENLDLVQNFRSKYHV